MYIYIAEGTPTCLLKLPDKEPCKGLFLCIAYIQECFEYLWCKHLQCKCPELGETTPALSQITQIGGPSTASEALPAEEPDLLLSGEGRKHPAVSACPEEPEPCPRQGGCEQCQGRWS